MNKNIESKIPVILSSWLMKNDKQEKTYSYKEIRNLCSCVPNESASDVLTYLIASQIVHQTPSNFYRLSPKGLKKRLTYPLVYDTQKIQTSNTTNQINPEEWFQFRKLCLYYADCVQYNERSDQYIKIVGKSCSNQTVKMGCSVYLIPHVMPAGWLKKPYKDLKKDVEFKYTSEQRYAVGSIIGRSDEVENYIGFPLMGHVSKTSDDVFYTSVIQIPIEVTSNRNFASANTITFSLDYEHAFINPQWIENSVPLENRQQIEEIEDACSEIIDGHTVLDIEKVLPLILSLSFYDDNNINTELPDQILPKMGKGRRHQFFNTAVIFQAKRLHYSKVLKKELEYIANTATDTELDNTALAYLFRKHPFKDEKRTAISVPFISTNQEQSEACELAQESRIFVVQGPPGTGKTQMAVNLIANCVFNGETVLFASTNHQAINAIRDRASSLFEGIPLVQFCANEDGDFTQSWYDIDLCTANSKTLLSKEILSDENLLASNAISGLKTIKEKYSIWNDFYEEYSECEAEYERNLKLCLNALKLISPEPTFCKAEQLFKIENVIKWEPSFIDKILFRVKKMKKKRDEALSWLKKNFPLLYDENYSELALSSDNFQRDINQAKQHMKEALKIQEQLTRLEAKIAKLPDWSEGFAFYSKKTKELTQNGEKAFSYRYYNRLKEGLSNEELEKLEVFQKKNKNLRGFDVIEKHSTRLALKKVDDEDYINFLNMLKEIYQVYPSWAVTLQSVSRAFPCIAGFVDQVIVDESSQCLPSALIPALFRAKRVLVVGDEKQFQPIAQLKNRTHQLILERYKMTLEEKSLWFTESSAYDIAQYHRDRNKYKIMLKEHFRCSDEIASFINEVVYDNKMRIRSSEHSFIFPQNCGYKHAIEWIDIKGNIEKEIDEVIKRVKLLVHNDYAGTIGIISPLRNVANKINERLYSEKLTPYVDKCSTAYSYQGGEQDLIIFVLGLNEEIRQGEQWYIECSENILNVAISRAKALLLVIGDKDRASMSQSCIIRRLSSYNPNIKSREPVCESIWEQRLVDELEKQSIDYKIQYPLVGRRLDVAILCDKCKLDVEVDGVAYHTNDDGYRKLGDMIRDQQILSCGWLVLRFWSYDLRDHMDACINRIKDTMRTGKVLDELEWRRNL